MNLPRPQSLTLVRLRGHDYGHDVGYGPMADHSTHLLIKSSRKPPIESSRIGRYLDGEEEVEGSYR